MGRLATGSTATTLNVDRVVGHALSQGASRVDVLYDWHIRVPVGLLVVLIGALKLHRIVRLHRSGIVEADRMDGRTFEEFLALMFRRLRGRAELTPSTGDYGADLVVTKNRVRQVVQAKRSNRPIGVKAVQEIAGARPTTGPRRR